MNLERLFKIVMSDYATERLKLEEQLESIMNSNQDIHTKTKIIKKVLRKITINEASMLKFASMIPNNNLQNNENDGTV
jgi:predicted nucleotidyltransferase